MYGEADTMAMTGHRSIQTLMRYFQTGVIGQTRAARLMGDDPPKRRRNPRFCGTLVSFALDHPLKRAEQPDRLIQIGYWRQYTIVLLCAAERNRKARLVCLALRFPGYRWT